MNIIVWGNSKCDRQEAGERCFQCEQMIELPYEEHSLKMLRRSFNPRNLPVIHGNMEEP